MLLSVPVVDVRMHEYGAMTSAEALHLLPPTPPSSAPASSQHPRQHHPARRVLRAVLSLTRQQRAQPGHRPGQQQQQKKKQQQEQPQPRAAAAVASTAAAAYEEHKPPLPLLLHSAASLPPSPPRPRHHHRRRSAEHEPAAAAAAAAATAEPAQQQQQQRHQQQHRLRGGGKHAAPNNQHNPLRALLRPLLHHSHRAARAARPQGPGSNDATPLERLVNVLTSIPFLAVGLHVLRTRRAPAARRFGRSFVAVGFIAGAYHACPRGHALRRPLRMLDYYSIALSSSALREAVLGYRLPRWAALAACALTPLKPTAVTGANLAAIELAYARAAWLCPRMRRAWRRHLAAAGVGLGCFLAEDAVVASGGPARFNALHGFWHLLSASALGLANALLSHVEQALLLEAAEVVAEGEI